MKAIFKRAESSSKAKINGASGETRKKTLSGGLQPEMKIWRRIEIINGYETRKEKVSARKYQRRKRQLKTKTIEKRISNES
jgi:hypothetical protein